MNNKIFKLIVTFTTLFCTIFLSLSTVTYAQDKYDNTFPVRVGIYYASNSKSQYNVNGNNLSITEGYENIFESGSNFATVSFTKTLYVSNQTYSSYTEAISKITLSDEFVYYSNGLYYTASLLQSSALESTLNSKVLISFQNNQKIAIDGSENLYIESSDGILKLENTMYRGKFNFYVKGSNVHAINELGMQDYLYGVLPKEMVSSWEIEALKAQAVVAKNYTITNYNKHKSDGFNVCATTHCQVYGGYSIEQEKTNRAVDLTEGIFMTYDSKPAEGYFHASSGGRTESIGNMWNYSLDYMVGVEDKYSLGTPYDNWQVSFTSDEIRAALLKKNVDVGNIVGVKILKLSENDRVMELGILGTKGMHTLKKDNIRSTLGSSKLKNTYFTLQNSTISRAYSNAGISLANKKLETTFLEMDSFFSNEFRSSNQDFVSSGTYVFNGKGNGHGIGLSQYGANNMAKQGYNFEEILKHYFKGISL